MKHYEYEIDANLKCVVYDALRKKRDLLRLLIYTVKSIIEQELGKKEGISSKIEEDNKIVIHVSKMNRLFYCLKNKIFSFQMPFTINVSETDSITLSFNGRLVIDSYISSLLITVFEEEELFSGSIADIYDRIADIIHNNYEDSTFDEEVFWELISHLMLYEPGYIRYDDDIDVDRTDPIKHPRYHLDINYESTATYKIGLSSSINCDRLRILMDITEKCVYICDV